jgi:hypothetical protein
MTAGDVRRARTRRAGYVELRQATGAAARKEPKLGGLPLLPNRAPNPQPAAQNATVLRREVVKPCAVPALTSDSHQSPPVLSATASARDQQHSKHRRAFAAARRGKARGSDLAVAYR